MPIDSWLSRIYWIFLHALALYGLLTVFYTGISSSRKSESSVFKTAATLLQTVKRPSTTDKQDTTTTKWTFNATRDADNLGLSEDQCDIAFPKQYTDIQNNVANLTAHPITLSDLDIQDGKDERVRAMIYNGELFIISRKGGTWVQNGVATVHSLQRALAAFPDRKSLPNIEFFLFTHDVVGENRAIWTYTKPTDVTDFMNQWLMPDFGFWAWPHSHIGSYNHIRNEMRKFEDQVDFEEKTPQLVWRGNKNTAPHRPPFFKATEGKDWANVSGIDWGRINNVGVNDERSSYLSLWDHCRFQMVMDISGRTWSGKGKYIQNCESVYVTHASKWLKTTTYALEVDGPEQNFVQVKEDWSDLEKKVTDVLQSPSTAKRLAKKGVEDFRDRYLTPAAEACYWRALIRGYGKVSFEPDLYEQDGITLRGAPFEAVAISPMMDPKKWWHF